MKCDLFKQQSLNLLAMLTLLITLPCQGQTRQGEEAAKGYLGQWTIDIEGGRVGWLEVRQEKDYLDADLLWGGGSVLPVASIYLDNDQELVVTRIREILREGDSDIQMRVHQITQNYEIRRIGDQIFGRLTEPQRNGMGMTTQYFTGRKLPDVPEAPDLKAVKYGKPIKLFNGKDLKGWMPIPDGRANGFRAEDGVLVNDPVQPEGDAHHIRYANLRTEAVYGDCNLKIKVNVPEGSNSGIYLRGMYEIQVLDSRPINYTDSHHMGALYSRIEPSVKAEKEAGTWQELDITLCDRHMTVILNGSTIIDNQPVYGPTGGAIQSDVFSEGPVLLQGDHGAVSFKDIVLTPIVE